MKHWILLSAMLGFCLGGWAQGQKKIGLVAESGVKPGIRQQIWKNILQPGTGQILKGEKYRFKVALISDDELNAPEKLNAYALIVIPSGRSMMSPEMLDNLKVYLHQGGKVVREMNAVALVDVNADGGLNRQNNMKANANLARAYWREVAGALPESQALVRRIRFGGANNPYARDLPAELADLDFPFEITGAGSAAFLTCYYTLAGARAVAEGELLQADIPKNSATPLDGIHPVVTLNAYGAGYCVSLGLNIVKSLHKKHLWPSSIYLTFYKNLMDWALNGSPKQKEEDQ